jgi:NifB/MoaA-like Fe-S oxidoreductase
MISIESLIEVTLKEPDDFLKVKETLTRIGVASKKSNTLFQSCHILHKQGKYYIVHFKELFALDGKPTDLNEDDVSRRNTIAKLLAEWDLVSVVNPAQLDPADSMSSIKVIPFNQKSEWELVAKYNIGKKK